MRRSDKMTPMEALIAVAEYSFVMDTVDRRPGAFIERMSKDVREKLEKLTSDDALKVRIDWLHP